MCQQHLQTARANLLQVFTLVERSPTRFTGPSSKLFSVSLARNAGFSIPETLYFRFNKKTFLAFMVIKKTLENMDSKRMNF